MTRDGDSRVGTATTRRAVDGALVVVAATALAAGFVGGAPWRGLGLLLVVSVGTEYALSSAVTGGIIDGVADDGSLVRFDPERYANGGGSDDASGENDRYATLGAVVASVRRDLGVGPLAVAVDPDGESGVTILGDDERTVLFVSGPVLERLDESALRGVVAHELAHVARGHLDRSPFGPAVAHIVGVVVLWLVALHATVPVVTTIVAGSYLVAGVSRRGGAARLWYLLGSLGFVLVPLGLSAYASRLQEYEADDVAVEHAGAEAFCRGLYLVTTAEAGGAGGVGAETPDDERGPIDRLTAPYPTMDRRFARQGFDTGTVAERAGRARDPAAPAAEDAGASTD